MSITDWLEQVHRQPHGHRRRLMWVSVACTLVVIGFFWVLSMKYELKVVFDRAKTQPGIEQAFKQTVADKTPTLGDTLKASVQDFLSIFAQPTDQVQSPAPTAPPQPKFLPD